ncbi:MAG: OmpA family protein [Piscinibacter sp.]|nr:OmpA family protein [Piscinibacter sp.]
MRAAERRRRAAALPLLVALAALVAAPGRAQERVFGEQGLTEKALVEALGAPAPRGADPALGATRGFRPAQPSAAPPAAARASILVTFVVGSAELTTSARAALDIVARALQSERLAPRSFTIEGHADPRGDDAANLALSQARARSVVDYLVARHGVAAARLEAVGFGSTRLLNPRDLTAPENRRVTLVAR